MTGLSSPRAPASRSSNAGDPAVDRRLPLRFLDSSARPRTKPRVTGRRSGSSIPSTGSSCEPTYNRRVVSGHQSVSKRRSASGGRRSSRILKKKKLQRNVLQLRSRTSPSKHTWITIVTETDASVTKNLIEMVVTTHNDSLLEKPIAWLWPARLLASLHQHQHETFHVTKFLFDDEGVPIALPPPPPMGVCPSTCPPPQSKFLRRGPGLA